MLIASRVSAQSWVVNEFDCREEGEEKVVKYEGAKQKLDMCVEKYQNDR